MKKIKKNIYKDVSTKIYRWNEDIVYGSRDGEQLANLGSCRELADSDVLAAPLEMIINIFCEQKNYLTAEIFITKNNNVDCGNAYFINKQLKRLFALVEIVKKQEALRYIFVSVVNDKRNNIMYFDKAIDAFVYYDPSQPLNYI